MSFLFISSNCLKCRMNRIKSWFSTFFFCNCYWFSINWVLNWSFWWISYNTFFCLWNGRSLLNWDFLFLLRFRFLLLFLFFFLGFRLFLILFLIILRFRLLLLFLFFIFRFRLLLLFLFFFQLLRRFCLCQRFWSNKIFLFCT